MSYILDALKKAESERNLGSVPNVYMEPVPIAKFEKPPPAWRRPSIWIAALLLAAAGIGAMWWIGAQSEAPPATVSATPMMVAQAHNQVEPAAPDQARQKAAAAPNAPQSNARPLKNDAGEHADKNDAPARKPKPAASPKPPTEPAAIPAAKKPAHEKVAALEKAPAHEPKAAKPAVRAEPEKSDMAQLNLASAAPSLSAAEMQVSALRDLPDHVQRGIPPISIGGYIYSPNPAERSMLLNNRLIREGEQTASGLVLEKMMPKEAVLSFQGQRFRLAY